MRRITRLVIVGLFVGFTSTAGAQNPSGSGLGGRRFDVPPPPPAGMDRGSTLNRGAAGDNSDRGANPSRNSNTRSPGARPTPTPPGSGTTPPSRNSIVRDTIDLLNALNSRNTTPNPGPTTYRQPSATTGGGTASTGSGPVSGGTADTPGWNGGRYNDTTSTAPPQR
jgi:hypothetical protein